MPSMYVGETSSALSPLPLEPDSMGWGLQDISDQEAGRVQDANCTMYKRRIGQKRKLSLSWKNPSFEDASKLVRMFNPEYVYVRMPDLLAGGMATFRFYTGDKSAPFRQISAPGFDGKSTVMSTLSFDLIEQ